MTPDQKRARADLGARSWVVEFGGDPDPKLFTDPKPSRTPALIARAVKHSHAAAAAQGDQDLISRAAQIKEEDAALERAMELYNSGRPVSRRLLALAARAARRQSVGALSSSAERLAAPALRRRARERAS